MVLPVLLCNYSVTMTIHGPYNSYEIASKIFPMAHHQNDLPYITLYGTIVVSGLTFTFSSLLL